MLIKMEAELTTSTETGGLVSLAVMLLLSYLLVYDSTYRRAEIYAWRMLEYKYEFLVDQNHLNQMDVNLDITIAMDCKCKQ